jgi:hypothetical protein
VFDIIDARFNYEDYKKRDLSSVDHRLSPRSLIRRWPKIGFVHHVLTFRRNLLLPSSE